MLQATVAPMIRAAIEIEESGSDPAAHEGNANERA